MQSIPFNYGDHCDQIDLEQPIETEETLEGQKENLRLQAQNLYFFQRGSDVDEIEEKEEDMDAGNEESKMSSQMMYDFEVIDNTKDLQEAQQDYKDTLLEPNNKSVSGHVANLQIEEESSEYQQIDIELLDDSHDHDKFV